MLGRVFFTYLGVDEAFDPIAHAREDEVVLGCSIDQDEAEFPGATVELQARPEGFLRFGRRVALSIEEDGVAVPLLIGWLTGAPRGLRGDVVTVEILGRVPDWQAQQDALMEALSVAPYVDPLVISPDARLDPAEVLSGRGGTVAWGRISGAPAYNDLLTGGFLHTFTRVARDGVSVDVESPPLSSVTVALSASWTEDVSVVEDVAWAHEPGVLAVVANEAIGAAWPAIGLDIGGDWIVDESSLTLAAPRMVGLGEIAAAYDSAVYSGDVPVYDAIAASVRLRNTRGQARSETVRLTVSAGVQDLMNPGTEAIEIGARRVIGSGDEVKPWEPTAAYSLGDVRFYGGQLYEAIEAHTASFVFDHGVWSALGPEAGRIGSSFFQTDRGAALIAHGLQRAMARLRYAARSVRVKFSVPLYDATNVVMGDRARIFDQRLPGGFAEGKIISYRFQIPPGGGRWCEIEIACAVGLGGFDTPSVPLIAAQQPVVLGPVAYPCLGVVSPTADEQIAALREAPDAYSVEIVVKIDAPAVPVASALAHTITADAGTLSIPVGVDLR